MEPSTLSAALTQVTTAYSSAAGDLMGAIPAIALVAIPVGLLTWGIFYVKRVFRGAAR